MLHIGQIGCGEWCWNNEIGVNINLNLLMPTRISPRKPKFFKQSDTIKSLSLAKSRINDLSHIGCRIFLLFMNTKADGVFLAIF